MVRSRQAWLKSTKTCSPRSSFHHDGRDEVGQPALELAGDADDAVPHVEELVGRARPAT